MDGAAVHKEDGAAVHKEDGGGGKVAEMDSQIHSSFFPQPIHKYTCVHMYPHNLSYICPLLRSNKDKEGRRSEPRENRHRVKAGDVLRCQDRRG
jgi:hypothetical protein